MQEAGSLLPFITCRMFVFEKMTLNLGCDGLQLRELLEVICPDGFCYDTVIALIPAPATQGGVIITRPKLATKTDWYCWCPARILLIGKSALPGHGLLDHGAPSSV